MEKKIIERIENADIHTLTWVLLDIISNKLQEYDKEFLEEVRYLFNVRKDELFDK